MQYKLIKNAFSLLKILYTYSIYKKVLKWKIIETAWSQILQNSGFSLVLKTIPKYSSSYFQSFELVCYICSILNKTNIILKQWSNVYTIFNENYQNTY